MFRRYFAGLFAIAFALMGSLVFASTASASPAWNDPIGIGVVHITAASDYLAPLSAIVDVAVLPDRLKPDTPERIDIAGMGPISPVYLLSSQTDGASLNGFHRRC